MALTENYKRIARQVAARMDDEVGLSQRTTGWWPVRFIERFIAALPKPKPVAWCVPNKSRTAPEWGNKWMFAPIAQLKATMPLYTEAPIATHASEQNPIAWVTTNEDGDYAMLFFDKQEARSYSGDDEPIGLAPISSSAPQPDYKAQRDVDRYRWMCEYLIGHRSDLDDAIISCTSKNDMDGVIDAAIASVKGGA